MSMFYNPLIINFEDKPIIVYPCEGLESCLSREKPNAIEAYLLGLYNSKKSELSGGEFYVNILWDNDGEIMTDVWIYTQTASWGSGALMDAKIFRGTQLETEMGVSAEFGAIVLGKEAEHRNFKVKDMKEYIQYRPKLPDDLVLGEDFHKS
jgi:hypothetical protein